MSSVDRAGAAARRAIGAVVVAYHPDMPALERLVDCYLAQVDRVVVVDNTPGGAGIQAAIPRDFDVLVSGANLGIAAALNAGIRHLMACGCDHYVLSDQDSLPGPGFVDHLYLAFRRLREQGVRVATVGALFVDPRNNHAAGFAQDGWSGNRHSLQADATGMVPASYVITSGSIVSREAITDIGMMDEGLFIDYVDMEWCFRARARGYAVYGEPAAVMEHTLGDSTISFWLFGSRQKGLHSPARVYFQNRNVLLLCRMPHVEMSWKFWALVKRPAAILLYLVSARGRRLRYLASACNGLVDGLKGRYGNGNGLL